MDENTALGILFGNTRRVKRTVDLITIARACDFLVRSYGSKEAVAKKIGLSPEMIREFMKLLTLVPEVQKIVKSREIDRLDVAYKLSKISDPKLQVEAARRTRDLSSKAVRDMERLMTHAKLPVDQSAQKAVASRLKDMHVLVLDFTEEQFKQIARRARELRTPPVQLVKEVILQWLERASDALKYSNRER
jgi:hypothetical protein